MLEDGEELEWARAVQKCHTLQTIAFNSRGRFATHFIEKVAACMKSTPDIDLCDLLDEAFGDVSQRAHKGKVFLDSKEGKIGQRVAISYANVNDTDAGPELKRIMLPDKTLPVMQRHFSNLTLETITDINLDNTLLIIQGADTKWEPESVFPLIEDDLLLYLAILGGKLCPSYYDAINEIPHSTKAIFIATKPFNSDVNRSAQSLDGGVYENMVTHAIFSSSRRHGVQGVAFNEFFCYLLGEFLDDHWKPVELKLSSGKPTCANDFLKSIQEKTIPFLAPANSTWPTCILELNKEDNINFGHFSRAANKDRCDGYVGDLANPTFVVECKYHTKAVTLDIINTIVQNFETRMDIRTKLENERDEEESKHEPPARCTRGAKRAREEDTPVGDVPWDWDVFLVFCPQLELSNDSTWEYYDVDCVFVELTGQVTWIHKRTRSNRKGKSKGITERVNQKLVIVVATGYIKRGK